MTIIVSKLEKNKKCLKFGFNHFSLILTKPNYGSGSLKNKLRIFSHYMKNESGSILIQIQARIKMGPFDFF